MNIINNYKEEILNLSSRIKNILLICGQIGDILGYDTYVVGGFVRDLIMGIENFDIDIVVVGDSKVFTEELNNHLNGKITTYKKFLTASIKSDDFKIDIVTARKERYEYPASMPIVEPSDINHDLHRRDFSINAMAISLNSKSFGQILDPCNGQNDLQNGIIKVLYSGSFIDDPTRVFRAVKFSLRYNFEIETTTKKYIKDCILQRIHCKLNPDRIKDELSQIDNEKNYKKMYKYLNELGLMKDIKSLIK